MHMIKFDKVSKTYKNGTHALYDISLEIKDGDFVYIIGETGSGKSTMIKILDGEEVPTSGSVTVSGINIDNKKKKNDIVDVGKLKKRKVPLYRRNIGVVFQDYRLLPKKTVFENVAYAMEVVDTPKDKLRPRVREVLKLVGLADKSNSFPNELSGGQQQRTAIARAIANRPKILIADEPTGNLDPKKSNEIINLFEKINREENTTILIVTHDIDTVRKHPKRTIEINNGHIVRDKEDGIRNVKTTIDKADTQTLSLDEIKDEDDVKQEEQAWLKQPVEVKETPVWLNESNDKREEVKVEEPVSSSDVPTAKIEVNKLEDSDTFDFDIAPLEINEKEKDNN